MADVADKRTGDKITTLPGGNNEWAIIQTWENVYQCRPNGKRRLCFIAERSSSPKASVDS